MKKCFPFFILSLFLLNFSFAQDAKKIQIYLSGGVSIPASPSEFKDFWSLGFNGGGGVGYIFSPIFSANVYFDYNSMTLNEDKFLEELGATSMGLSIDGGAVNIITVMVNVKTTLIAKPQSVSPYLKAGLGLLSLSATDVTFSYMGESFTQEVDVSEEAFGVLFGGGIDFPVSLNVLIFVEGNYGIGFTEDESTGYITIKGGVIILL